MDWIGLAQDRDRWRVLVNTVMILLISLNAGKFLSSYATGGFSRRPQLHEVSMIVKRVIFPSVRVMLAFRRAVVYLRICCHLLIL
jgi:ABC-type uncharacterized transport system permease subunit